VRSFAKFSPAFWTGDLGRALRGDHLAQAIAVYLVTGPSCNSIGLYWLPVGHLAHDLGSPLEEASKALRRVSEGGFCTYDEGNEIVWVHLHARHQHGETMKPTDNNIPAVRQLARECSKSFLCRMFWEMYGEAYHLGEPPEASPFEAPSKPLRSPSRARDRDRDLYREGDREREGDARGGGSPPVLRSAPPPASKAPARKKAQEPLPDLPAELDTPEMREAWAIRISERAEKGFKLVPSAVALTFKRLVRVKQAHGIAAAVECVERAASSGNQGVVFAEDLAGRRSGKTNGYDRDAIRQEHKQAGNSQATKDRLAAAVAEHERKRKEYLDSFLTEGPPNDDDD
jgi:hypothetical protein